MLNVETGSVTDLKKVVFVEEAQVESGINLSAELIDRIISVDGFAACGKATVEGGFINYSGKVFFNVIFSGDDLERVESGVKFDFKKPYSGTSDKVLVRYETEDFAVKAEGGMLIATCNLITNLTVFEEEKTAYVTNADCFVKTGEITSPSYSFFSCAYDGEDKFETARIKKVLSNRAIVSIYAVKTAKDYVTVEGEAIITFVLLPFLENSDIVKETRTVPFKYEIDASGAAADDAACVNACVKSVSVKVYTDDDGTKSSVETNFSIGFSGYAFGKRQNIAVIDAVKNDCDLVLSEGMVSYEALIAQKCVSDRVSGKATVEVPEYSRFVKLTGEGASVDEVNLTGGVLTVTGVIHADCVFVGDSGPVSRGSELLFEVSVDTPAERVDNVIVNVESLQGRLRSGKLEQDAVIRLCFCEYSVASENYVESITESEQKSADRSVIAIYSGRAGDEEWDVVKALREDISAVYELNPGLTFPLSGDEKIVVIKRKNN